MIVMYERDKQSVSYIQRKFGVSDFVVYSALRRSGVVLRPKGKGGLRTTSRACATAAVRMYAEGAGCEEVAAAFGVTSGTVLSWVRSMNVPVRPKGFQVREAHPGWGGGRSVRPDGYVLVLVSDDDPFQCMAQVRWQSGRYVLEHRLVMARHLGRVLTEDETVHHIDGNRGNNDISNLQLRHGRHGKGIVLCCGDCGSTNVVETHIC